MNILDREEFRLKLEEINHMVEAGNFKGAMDVVDSINWRRVKNVSTLRTVGKIYERNRRYEKSKEIFEIAYKCSQSEKSMKNILRHLIEVSLKMKDTAEAEEFYEEFKSIAPRDNACYILKYKILKVKNASLQEQISILEEYRDRDSDLPEKWLYELAELYYKADEKEKSKEICDEMILYFGEGDYVMKAMDLEKRMGVLSDEDKEKYENQFIPKFLRTDEDEVKTDKEPVEEYSKSDIESIRIRDTGSVETLQDKISKGIRDIFGSKKLDDELLEENASENEEKVQEEMLKNASEEDLKDIPELEQEDKKETEPEEKPLDFTMKMPELNIPKSMKKSEMMDSLQIPEVPKATTFFNLDEEESAKKEEFDFNLEDMIVAAATAQGIEIPKENPAEVVKEEVVEEEAEILDDPFAAELSGDAEETDEFEDELTEEEKQLAEAEFLNGPVQPEEAVKEEPVKENKYDIPDLEPEIILPGIEEVEDDFDADDFLRSLMNKEDEKDSKKEELELVEEIDEFEEEPEILEEPESDLLEEENEEEEEEEEILEPESEEEQLERFIESITPKDERDPMEIVPREYELTEEEKKLFSYFVKVAKMKEQLLDTLSDVQMAAADSTSRTGNVIVMGAKESGKTRLISSLIPAICKELNISASKVAYVFAEQINNKDIKEIIRKLAGGFLVIENANQLNQETAEQLDKLMGKETAGLTVILEDEKIGMRKMLARYPKLAKKFTSVINISTFTIDELVNFAVIYAKENGYKIDQMGMLALHNLIGSNRKEDEPTTIGNVKKMIDNAIMKSEGGIRKFKRGKRVDRDGYKVLLEKDFKNK